MSKSLKDYRSPSGAGADNRCKKCDKRVYEMEKIIADKAIYHKPCFRCVHCNRVLSLGNYAAIDEKQYCKPHFIELFKKKGKYDMGKQPEKKDTTPRQEPAKEASQQQSSQPASTRVNGSVEDEQEGSKVNEPVRYQEMNSVRSMFESASHSTPVNAPTPTKRVSKWDKPKEPARAPSPRQPEPQTEVAAEVAAEEGTGEELPPVAITRNLVARFRELEQTGESFAVDRKPVHKITPPRDELASGIEEALQQQRAREPSPEPARAEEIVKSGEALNPEDELPAPHTTRHMLAKFRSMEDVNQTPISPQQTKPVARTPSNDKQQKPRQSNRASPDSGIVDVELHSHVNGHQGDRQEEEETPEKELPEQGFTRNLVAKWRTMEETSPESVPQPVVRKDSGRQAKTPQQQLAAYRQSEASPTPPRQAYQDTVDSPQDQEYQDYQEEDDKEVSREGDNNEEDFLPPPSFTKNMLAKFQTLEAEAERISQENTTQPTQRKSFKWTVKEAPLINRSGMVWQEKRRGSSLDGDLDDEHYIDDSDRDYSQEQGEGAFYGNQDDTAEHIYEEQEESYHQDVIHADSPSEREEDLPPQALTRNMLAKFRSLEDVNQPPPSPIRAERQQKIAYSLSPATGTRTFSSTSSLNQPEVQTTHVYSDEDGPLDHYVSTDYYEQEVEGGEYENDPFHDPNLVRESDKTEEEELPEEGITRNLLAKFQSLQTAH